jgi:hypothetical protein
MRALCLLRQLPASRFPERSGPPYIRNITAKKVNSSPFSATFAKLQVEGFLRAAGCHIY